MTAASVAVATTWTAEVRMPARMTGRAIGISRRPRIWLSRIPMPLAASTRSRSTWLRPTYVLSTMGGMASATSAMSDGQNPSPRPSTRPNGKTIPSRPSEGMARPMLAMLTASTAPRPVWPMTSPTGSAISVPTASEAADSETCSHSRMGMPLRPDHVAGSANHASTWPKNSIGSAPPSGPRRERPLKRDEGQVRDDGEAHRQQDAGVRRRRPERRRAPVDAQIHDEVAESALSDQRSDRDEPHGGHGGDPNDGDDDRQGEGQLDAPQALPPGEAHPGSGFDGIGRHAIERLDDVADQDQHRVAHQG